MYPKQSLKQTQLLLEGERQKLICVCVSVDDEDDNDTPDDNYHKRD